MLHRRLRSHFAEQRLRRAERTPFAYYHHGFPFVCHPDWRDSVDCFRSENPDFWDIKIMTTWLKPGDTMIDLGANVGVYSFAAAAIVGKRSKVLAVDASPFIIDKLRETARLLPDCPVEPIHAAITCTAGSVSFHIRGDSSGTGAQSLRPSLSLDSAWQTIVVPARTLADLTALLPSFIKMDIEGAEVDALATAPAAWLDANGPFWLVEINPGALAQFGATPADVVRHFPAARYDRWLLSKHPIDPSASVSMRRLEDTTDFSDAHYYNLFALPKGSRWTDRAARIRALLGNAG